MYIVRACYVISIYLSISLSLYIYTHIHTCIFPQISGDLEYPMLKRGDTAEGSMPAQLSSVGNFAKLGWFQSFRFPTYSCLIIVSVRPRFTHTHKMSWPRYSQHDPIDVGSLHPGCRPQKTEVLRGPHRAGVWPFPYHQDVGDSRILEGPSSWLFE